MIASAHIAAGALCGLVAERLARHAGLRVASAFALGVVSHAVMDAIPHSDYAWWAKSTIMLVALGEVLLSALVLYALLHRRVTGSSLGAVVAGIAGAALPDAKFAAGLALPQRLADTVRRWGDALHGPFHADPPDAPGLALTAEIALAVVCFGVIALLAARRRQSP